MPYAIMKAAMDHMSRNMAMGESNIITTTPKD